MGIMLNELSRLYAADVQGQADPLPALPIQYVDYSQWQRKWLADGQFERQSDYWRSALSGAQMLLELPADRSRPLQQDFAGDALDVHLDASLTLRLKALSLRHGVTLYMTLLASWAAVLGRLSGQEEVVIGSPMAGRNRAEIETLIGFFVNTLALRIDLGDDPTIKALLARTKRRVLEAQAHQDLPFDQVVEAVKPPRSTGHSPIFQTMLTLNNQEIATLEMPGLTVLPIAMENGTEQFDLSLDISEKDGVLSGYLGYATSLFDRGTMARYLGYWVTWLRGMVSEEHQKASDLPILDSAERDLVLSEWNDTARDCPLDLCVHQLFEQQAARTPEATALVCGDEQLSYDELNRRANRLAHHLRTLGVVPDDRIAICVDRSIAMVVGLFGILKAGGAYVPIEPTTPAERVAYILADSTPVAVLVYGLGREAVRPHLPGDVPVLDLECDEHLWCLQPDGDVGPSAFGLTSRHLAYVIYTSGTTGTPKGVMIEHASVTARAVYGLTQYAITPQDRCLQFAAFSFDASVTPMFSTLAGGAALIVRGKILWSPDDVAEQIGRHRITIADVPTSYLEGLLTPDSQRAMRDLRILIIGGEAALSEILRSKKFRQTILNEYGPTEATVAATNFVIHPHAAIGHDTMYLPIGRPIANTRTYLLDERGVPVPIGVVGELYIGGDGVARGYLNQPGLTAERFLDDPFSPDAAARMYKTGDLGRWLADGNIEYLGRNDFQVKIRGFRIELGEIEAALAACEGVREAVVLAREDAPGEKRLVAYYMSDVELLSSELRETVSKKLPEYMLPSAFVRMDAWPLTPNGKLDRKALPAPEGDAYAVRGYEAPRGEVETALAQIWSEQLHVDRVGRHDNFFELGGNSIQLIRMIARLRDQRILLNLVDVYRLGTVQAIAAVAATSLPPLAERLAREGWPYVLTTLGASQSGVAVLLVDACEPEQRDKLRQLLSDEAAAEVAYIRVCSDPAAEEDRLQLHGLAALEIEARLPTSALVSTLETQLDQQRALIDAAATVQTYSFSAIQRNFQAWSTRNSVGHATVIGWFAPGALQAAFAALVCEQDLLRSAADLPASRWRLLDAAAVSAAHVPSIQLRPEPGLSLDAVFAQTLEALKVARSRSTLAYAGAWISVSETEHHLLLSIDHLIWDGVSSEALQRRLSALLREQSTPLEGSYRQFAEEIECHGDRATDAYFDRTFDRAAVAEAMASTADALARRVALPLRSVMFSMPLAATHSPAEQAFEGFRRWALRITALDRLGLVLTHHGRQRGAHGYFDHIGLFLDKIPFAVGADTALEALTDTVGELQKQGQGYVAMESRACADGLMPTLPMISEEVLFNFQSQTMADDVHPPEFNPQDSNAAMGDYRGILFEGFAQSRQMIGVCLFRGSDEDIRALVDEFQGCTVIESIEVPSAPS
ncbi:MAG: amino acid adenylation domain-containing protein [Lysobacteraceae bacterium]